MRMFPSSFTGMGTGVDNRIVRWDGTNGLQSSTIDVTDAGAVTGSTSITQGQVTWNNVNGFVSTQDMNFVTGATFDMNFTTHIGGGNLNFIATNGQANIVANLDCTFGSASGAFIFTAATGIIQTSTTGDIAITATADSVLLVSGLNVDLNAGSKVLITSATDVNLLATAGTFNISSNTQLSSNTIFFGTSNEGAISHDVTGFIFNPGPTVATEMVVGTTSGTANRNLRVFRMGLLGSSTSGTVGLNCNVSGAVRTALSFSFTVTSGTILAPLVLNTVNSTSGTATVFANTYEYTHNTTSATGAVSAEIARITMGTGAGILLPATTHYFRGITLDLTGKGVGGVHVAAAVIRQTALFQRRMTNYGGTATTDTTGCYWGDDLVMQAGSKVLYNGSETSTSTSLTVTKSNVYHLYSTGSSELQTFVGGSQVFGSTATLNQSYMDLGITDAKNIIIGTTTGTKFSTSTTSKMGWWNATPVVQSTGWTTSNVTSDKVIDANSTSIDEVADVLCTLIEQLKTYGILGA